MRATLLLALVGGLLAGPVAAQPPGSAPSQMEAFVGYFTQSPAVPPDIKLEYRPPNESSGASCRLVDWVLSPSSPAPASVVDYARTLRPVCSLPVSDIDPVAAQEALGSKTLVMKIDGDVVTLVARSSELQPPSLCCSLQGLMHRLGQSDIWALRYRLENFDQAMLTFLPQDARTPDQQLTYRGLRAPAPPSSAKALSGRIVEDTLYSHALQETRKLVIYVPKGNAPPGGWPALFLADGDVVYHDAGIVEALVNEGVIAPITLIGTVSGQEGIVEDRKALGIADLRAADYLQDYPPGKGRFNQHMEFLSRELVAYVRSKYAVTANRAQVAVSGYSNGGQLAFEAGLLHPEVFGAAIPMSAGGRPVVADEEHAAPRARFYASAGLYEDGFTRSTSASVAALKAANYEVEFTQYAAGHMSDQWDVALVKALPRVFGRGAMGGSR